MIEPRRRADPEYVGRFPILARLGAGGFGRVFVAGRPGHPGQRLAVKVVHSHIAEDPAFRARFQQEIVALKRVKSKFVPGLVEHGEHQDAPWLATELVHGPPLTDVVRGHHGPLPVPVLWWIGLGMVDAITAIHAAALVHRDLKPGNVLLVPGGPRVIDFGLAHLAELGHHSASRQSISTYQYASPEQLRGLETADRPADIFALGATLLFAATGHAPYGSLAEAQQARVNLAGLPAELGDVISRCLCPWERDRPQLAELRTLFADRVRRGRLHSRDESAARLPATVAKLLAAWCRRLDEVTGAVPGPVREQARGAGPSAPPPPTALDRTRALTDARLATAVFSAAPSRVRWSRRLGDWIRAPLAVNGGVAVAASLDGTVACFRTDSGEMRWIRNLAAPVHSAVLLGPGRGNGRPVYAGAADGTLHVIDAVSGHHRPVASAEAAISGPPVHAAGRIYAASADGCVHEIDPETLTHRVVFRLSGPAGGGLAAAGDVIVAAGADGYLTAIGVIDRRQRWHLPIGGRLFAAPLCVGRRLYFAGTDGMLWSVRADDGRGAVTVDVGPPVHAALARDGGRLYTGDGGGAVRAFALPGDDSDRPAALWSVLLGTEVSGIAASGQRVFGTSGDTVAELDPATGQVRWRHSLGASVAAAPAAADGFLYVADLDGVVTCLSVA